MGIFAYLGYFKRHEYLLKEVDEISSASCGAILATMFALGFTPDQVLERFSRVDFDSIAKSNLQSLLKNYGLIDHEPLRDALLEIMGSNPTFKDLDKKIYISAFCVNRNQTEYFSVDTHPDMAVIEAILMSISVPIMFSAYKHNDMMYVDGATREKFPMLPFINRDHREIRHVDLVHGQGVRPGSIRNLKDFLSCMFESYMANRNDYEFNGKCDLIDIEDTNIYNFSMTHDERVRLYMIGYNTGC